MYEAKLEFHEGWGVIGQIPSVGGMDIFWNHTFVARQQSFVVLFLGCTVCTCNIFVLDDQTELFLSPGLYFPAMACCCVTYVVSDCSNYMEPIIKIAKLEICQLATVQHATL